MEDAIEISFGFDFPIAFRLDSTVSSFGDGTHEFFCLGVLYTTHLRDAQSLNLELVSPDDPTSVHLHN